MKKLFSLLVAFFGAFLAPVIDNFVSKFGIIRFIIQPQGITPQQKISDVANKFGLQGLMNMQGTTRILYDTLRTEGVTVFEFFKNSQNRDFPLTNVGSFGNKLEQGESLAILNFHLSVIRKGEISGLWDTPLSAYTAVYNDLMLGEIELQLANQVVMKPIPLLNMISSFNKDSNFGQLAAESHTVFNFNTLITIPPLMDFIFRVRTTGVGFTYEGYENYLRLTIEGVGSILAPKNTF